MLWASALDAWIPMELRVATEIGRTRRMRSQRQLLALGSEHEVARNQCAREPSHK